MKIAFQVFAFVLITTAFCFAQDSTTKESKEKKLTASSEKLSGFEFLKQFEGAWSIVSKEPDTDDGKPGATHRATMKSRVVGEHWVVIEQRGKIGEVDFEAVQTIGYDKEKKQFMGSWIDSTSIFEWTYSGTIGEDGKLILTAEGPDWTNPEKNRRYRDVYEFKTENEIASLSQMMNDEGKWETFMTSSMTKPTMKTTVTPFLMFIGQAEAAMDLYKTVFTDMQMESMNKYKAGEAGKEGTVQLAEFVIAGQRVKCIDSPAVHDFDFTPSFSFFVECENEEQLKDRFTKLAEGGKVMMPIDNYGFSKQFGWVSDKFGVSWQLNLP